MPTPSNLAARALALCLGGLSARCSAPPSSSSTATASSAAPTSRAVRATAERASAASSPPLAPSGVEESKTVAPSSAYTDPVGGYSVQFRVPPEVTRRRVPDGDASSLTIAAVAIDGDRFQSSSFLELDHPAIVDCTMAIAVHGIGHPGCKPDKTDDTTQGGLAGAEISFRCNDGVQGMKRLFCKAKPDESRLFLYDIEFLADRRMFDESEARAFLDGFKLVPGAAPK